MKIGLIVPGGVDRSARVRVIPVILSLIERLARRHEVVVVALQQEPDAGEYPLLGARVINLGLIPARTRFGRWASQSKRVISILRSTGGKFDVLHAFWAQGPGTVAVTAGALLRIPVVVSIGGGELVWLPEIQYGGQRHWLGRKGISSALRTAAAVSACSRYTLRALAEKRSDALWLPWSVDSALFSAEVQRPPGPPWRLLHVASLNRVKDQATMLRAVRLVLDSGVSVELDCIGEDTLDGAMQRMTAELRLGDSVKFHGFLPLDETIPFYRRAHLYVQSSLHENTPATVLEAAAAGVPTVGTAVGLVAELAPEAALAVPVRDPDALANGILALLADPPRRARLGGAAQEFVRIHDADWTAAQFEALYRRILRP
jgi:glycosyltransferase involved in cell wall biosynthesis